MSSNSTEALRAPRSVVNAHSGSAREIISFALPLMVAFLSFSIMGLVDSLIIGHVGTDQQAGVGMGAGLCFTLFFFFTGTMSVMSTFVAQANGAGRHERIRRYVNVGFALVLPMGLCVWPLQPLAPWLVEQMGTTASVRPHVVAYMQVELFALPFWLINYAISGFLRGMGDMKTPMVITLIANAFNACLATIFVFGTGPIPAMSVKGAALATVLAGAISSLLYLRVYFSRANHARFQTRQVELPAWSEVREFLRVGMPAGAGGVAEMACWTLLTIYISRIAPEALAASTIVWQIIHFSFMPTVALSIASSTLVGQYLGAERVDLAAKTAKRGILMGVCFMSAVGGSFAFFRDPLITFFNSSPAVLAIGRNILLIAAGFQVFDALGITCSGVLRGAGDTRFPFIMQLCCGWLLFVPLIFILGEGVGLGVYGPWLAGLIFLAAVATGNFLRYYKGGWKRLRLVR